MGNRAQDWQQLKDSASWDLIVVGGGITGAGIALAGARVGMRVLLLEQRDYAWGTSSRSSKMVHGGLRYLAQGDVSLTRHSLQEREYLIKALPGLVDRMGYYYVLSKKAPPRFAVKLLLWMYDWFAGVSNHRYVSRQGLGSSVSGLNTEQLNGAYYYTDAVTDDSRLVMRMIEEAKQAGAHCINYVKVTGFKSNLGDKISSPLVDVDIANQQTGEKASVSGAVLVNATGAWADRLRNKVNPEIRVRPQRGSHILVSQDRLKVDAALTLMHPTDGRYHFIYPWGGKTVIGTTDLDHKTDLDEEAALNTQEQDYLLLAANHAFPQAQLCPEDIISTWSGVRPIIASDNARDPSKERRDHAVWVDGPLVTVSGGKLTTFRLIALDVLTAISKHIPRFKPQIDSADVKADFINPVSVNGAELRAQGAELSDLYLARYGNSAQGIVQLCRSESRADELAVIADTEYSVADIRWALRYEQVEHLDDLLLRRTHLGLILPRGAEVLFSRLKDLCADELDWSEDRWLQELTRYQNIIVKYYSSVKSVDKNPDNTVVA